MQTEKMVKILHVSSAITWRGGEQQILNLLEGFLEFESCVKHHVFCAKGSEIEARLKHLNFSVSSGKKHGSISLSYTKSLISLLQKYKPTLIHVHDSHAHTATIIAHKILGIKTKIILHRRVDFPVGKSLFSKQKYNYPYIKMIICVSSFIQGMLPSSLAQKSCVILSSYNSAEVSQRHSIDLRTALGLSSNKILVGNVSALADHKDYETFLKVALALRDDDCFHFVIVGEGPDRLKLESFIKQHQLASKVTMMGFIPEASLLIKQLDIFLITSKTEGLGSVVLQAFAQEIPVVSSNAGGLVELVDHNKTGLLAKVADINSMVLHVKSLKEDSALRQRLTKNAILFVESMDHITMAKTTLGIYNSLLR